MKRNQYFGRIVLGSLALVFLLAALVVTVQAASDPGTDSTAPTANWGGCQYWVRPGDNLFRIAARSGVSWWYLAQINGLVNPNYLHAGMLLEIPCGSKPPYPPRPPKPCAPSTKYVVQPQDNLYRIAFNFGTTINAIRDANQLWGRVLRPGMILVIPCPGSVTYPGQTPPPPEKEAQPTPAAPLEPQGTLPAPTQAAAPPANQRLAPEPSATVTLQNDQVAPSQVTVKAGESVLWINADKDSYTIVSGVPDQPNDFFQSPAIPSGGTFLFKFDAAGNYSYFIKENKAMTGQVNVTPQ